MIFIATSLGTSFVGRIIWLGCGGFLGIGVIFRVLFWRFVGED